MNKVSVENYPELQKAEWISEFERALRTKSRGFNLSVALAIGERIWPSSFLLQPSDVAVHFLTFPKGVHAAMRSRKTLPFDEWVSEFLALMAQAGVNLRRRDDVLLATCAWEAVGHMTPAFAVEEHMCRRQTGRSRASKSPDLSGPLGHQAPSRSAPVIQESDRENLRC